MNADGLSFDMPDLAHRMELLTAAEIDRLPFGVIKLNAENELVFYNATERRLSGAGERLRLGQSWLEEIAPCMNNPTFAGHLRQARLNGTLDVEFVHVGDFKDRLRELLVRVQSAPCRGCWIFILRS